jgi:transposase
MISPAKRGGRRREFDVRGILNGNLDVLRTRCRWRYVPKDLPPRSTLHGYFQRWDYGRTWQRIHHELYGKCREQEDRQTRLTARVIDSQSVKRAKKGGTQIDPEECEAGKKISGKKRHNLVDIRGLVLHAMVHAADIQDRVGGVLVDATMFGLYPFLEKLFGDGGYQGPRFR